MKRSIYLLIINVLVLFSCSQNTSQNIQNGPLIDKNVNSVTQWRGQNRNGIYNETGLLKKWDENGPKLIWSREGIGKGYSSVIIVENTVFTSGIQENQDALIALDLNGNIKWTKPIGRSWEESFPESRCTPTYDNGKLYAVSGAGEIACFEAKDGKRLWGFDASGKFGTTFGEWGISESLLIVDDKVIFTPCGNKTTMVALDKNTGETIWQSETLSDKNAYSSPILIERGGKKMVVNVSGNYTFGVDAQTGKMLWKHDLKQYTKEDGGDINCNTPLYSDGCIFITSGYNDAGLMFSLSESGDSLTLKWRNDTLDTHHGNVVLVDGYIYGSNWINNGNGKWVCLDWNSGKTRYETKWKNKGSIIANDGLLYCYEEKNGNIALVKADPNAFEVISSFEVPFGKGPYWSHPVICDGRLYVRHEDVLMVYNIKG